MKRIVLIITILAVVICTVSVWSQSGHPGRPGNGESGRPFGMGRSMMSCPAMAVMPPHAGMVDRLTQPLQLTKAQTAKLNKIVAGNEKKMRSLREVASKSSQALHASLLAVKYSAKNVKNLSIKAEKAEAALISASIDEWTQIRSILTSKQSANLQKVMGAHRPGPGAPGFPQSPAPAQNGVR